jgi:hypothetical protein
VASRSMLAGRTSYYAWYCEPCECTAVAVAEATHHQDDTRRELGSTSALRGFSAGTSSRLRGILCVQPALPGLLLGDSTPLLQLVVRRRRFMKLFGCKGACVQQEE